MTTASSNSVESTPLDLAVRQQALDISRSFAVSAPAGSGKTSLLVQRVLRLLAISERPEEILAITFTRKAAAEMRHRILDSLRNAASEKPAENSYEASLQADAKAVLKRDAQLGWNLLENPERLRLQTIDGFCSYLTQRLCLETGLSHPGNLVERPGQLYRLAAEQLLTHINREDALGDAVRHLVRHFEGNQDELAGLLASLLDSRASWLDLVLNPEFGEGQLMANFTQLIDGELSNLRRQLVHIDIAELRELFAYSQRNLPGEVGAEDIQFSDKAYCFSRYLEIWQSLTNMLLTQKGEVRSPKGINIKLGFPPKSAGAEAEAMLERIKAFLNTLEGQPELVTQLNRVRKLPLLENQNSEANETLSSLALCLPVLAAELKLAFASAGEADFSAISISALEALGEPDNPTRLNLRLDYRIQHILVDEFQDTSALQMGLLERLTAGWEAGDGRTLFLVGDAMQSIYGFRKANVSLFIRARELGIGTVTLQPLDLGTNFRSAPAIVDWVNQSFTQVFPARDDRARGQVQYRASSAQKAINTEASVQLNGYRESESEADAIAASIAAKLSGDCGDIAILVRARTHLKQIVEALKARKIPWQAQNIEPLGQRMHVLDMHSLVRLLHSPGDRIAWLSLLRSPMLGLDMSDLHTIANSDSNCLWNNIQNVEECSEEKNTEEQYADLSTDAKERLGRFAELLSEAQQQLGLSELRELVAALWQQLGGNQSLFKSSYQQDLDDYLSLLESQAQGNLVQDMEAFEEELGQLYARPDTGPDCPLKIMTIHAAKGLEFDHVYLPQLQRSTAGMQQNPALVWQEREFSEGHTAFLAAAKPAKNDSDSVYKWLLADEREKVLDESARLLYVACTRAKLSLTISGLIQWDDKKEDWKAPTSNSLLALLWPEHQEEFLSGMQREQILTGEEEVPVLTGIRRIESAAIVDLPDSLIQQEELEAPETYLSAFKENLIQRVVGNLLHYNLMEVALGQSKTESQHREDWTRKLRVSGLSETDQTEALKRLKLGFTKARETDFGQWVLNPDHQESACELEIEQLLADGSLSRSIVDRTFVAKDPNENGESTRWIIDYKSAMPSAGQSESDFLKSQEEKYRDQLARYRSLFEGDQAIKTLLYFPAANLHQEVEF